MYYRPVTSDQKDREYDNASPTVPNIFEKLFTI